MPRAGLRAVSLCFFLAVAHGMRPCFGVKRVPFPKVWVSVSRTGEAEGSAQNSRIRCERPTLCKVVGYAVCLRGK